MIACFVTVLPALMASTRLVTLWNVVGLKLGGDICEVARLFQGLSRWEARKVVTVGKLREFEEGETVLRKGGAGEDRAMYLVLRGAVRVQSEDGDGSRVLAEFGPGQIFGEMALVDGRERSADVVSEGASEVLGLTAEDLNRLERRFPRTALKILHNLSMILSDRLRTTTSSLVDGHDPGGKA